MSENDTLDQMVVMLDKRSEPRIKLLPFDEIKLGSERRYLVKGLIPRVGLCLAWGPPKCGKSFWAFDLAMHLALGWPYRGRRVQGGPVVYCAFEGAHGFGARIEAFRQRFLSDNAEPVAFYLEPVTLDLVRDHAALIRAIKATDERPVMVVLDTLNRSLKGSESSDEDMTLYVRAADTLREAFGCAVLIVHHCGVDGSRPRGHTSLIGAVDAQIAVKRDGAGNIEAKVEHMKDGPEGDVIYSRLEAVEVRHRPGRRADHFLHRRPGRRWRGATDNGAQAIRSAAARARSVGKLRHRSRRAVATRVPTSRRATCDGGCDA